jgi:Flp pilus assembly CpaF family ATPase/NAD-dependent dihydropyrimidine dehydrogenase PreA subunit
MHLHIKQNIKLDKLTQNLFVNCPYQFQNIDLLQLFPKDTSIIDKNKIIDSCKQHAIFFSSKNIISIDQTKCNGCKDCIKQFPNSGIIFKNNKAYICDLCSNQSFNMYCYKNNKDIFELVEDIESFSKQDIYNKYLGYQIKQNYEIQRNLSKKVTVDTNNVKRYILNHPILSLQEIDIINNVLDSYKQKPNIQDYIKESEGVKIKEELESELIDFCYVNNLELDDDQFNYILDVIFANLYNYGPLSELLDDDSLEEISVIGINKPIYVYSRLYGWLETNLEYVSSDILKDLINKISWHSNKYITLKNPLLNTTLKDNSRLNAIVNPITETPCLTIRKFTQKPFTIKDLLEFNTISLDALCFLYLVFLTDSNVFVVGNTGSGKTTTLNTLLSFIPPFERFVIVEEVREINISQEHKVCMLVNEDLNINMEDLVINTLRMRPDRVIIGEVRAKEEAKALIESMLCGQAKGTYTTFHAQSAMEALLRLKSYGIMPCDLGVVDLIITQKRYNKYTKGKISDLRNVTEICEVVYEDNKLSLNKLFEFDNNKELLKKISSPKKLLHKFQVSFGVNSQKDLDILLTKIKKQFQNILNDFNPDFTKINIQNFLDKHIAKNR